MKKTLNNIDTDIKMMKYLKSGGSEKLLKKMERYGLGDEANIMSEFYEKEIEYRLKQYYRMLKGYQETISSFIF